MLDPFHGLKDGLGGKKTEKHGMGLLLQEEQLMNNLMIHLLRQPTGLVIATFSMRDKEL